MKPACGKPLSRRIGMNHPPLERLTAPLPVCDPGLNAHSPSPMSCDLAERLFTGERPPRCRKSGRSVRHKTGSTAQMRDADVYRRCICSSLACRRPARKWTHSFPDVGFESAEFVVRLYCDGRHSSRYARLSLRSTPRRRAPRAPDQWPPSARRISVSARLR